LHAGVHLRPEWAGSVFFLFPVSTLGDLLSWCLHV
jgi:hypothetical protein